MFLEAVISTNYPQTAADFFPTMTGNLKTMNISTKKKNHQRVRINPTHIPLPPGLRCGKDANLHNVNPPDIETQPRCRSVQLETDIKH